MPYFPLPVFDFFPLFCTPVFHLFISPCVMKFVFALNSSLVCLGLLRLFPMALWFHPSFVWLFSTHFPLHTLFCLRLCFPLTSSVFILFSPCQSCVSCVLCSCFVLRFIPHAFWPCVCCSPACVPLSFILVCTLLLVFLFSLLDFTPACFVSVDVCPFRCLDFDFWTTAHVIEAHFLFLDLTLCLHLGPHLLESRNKNNFILLYLRSSIRIF